MFLAGDMMGFVEGIISILVIIALIPVITCAGFLVLTIALGIIMAPLVCLISFVDVIRTKKEIAKKENEANNKI